MIKEIKKSDRFKCIFTSSRITVLLSALLQKIKGLSYLSSYHHIFKCEDNMKTTMISFGSISGFQTLISKYLDDITFPTISVDTFLKAERVFF